MNEAIRRVPFEFVDSDGERVYARACHHDEPRWIDSWTIDILQRLRGLRTADEHVGQLRDHVGLDAAELREQIQHLRTAGFVLTWPEIAAIAAGAAAPRELEPVTTLVLVACGKPQLAARALGTFGAGAATNVLIVDDSSADVQPQMLDALRATGVPATYIGQRHKRELARRLVDVLGAEAGAPVEFALHGPPNAGRTAGANRNAAFLAAAGVRFVSVDDDTFGPLAVGGVPDAPCITGAFDPTDLALFDGVAEALDIADARRGPLAAHGSVLGRSIGALEPTHGAVLGDELLADLLTGAGTVRAAMTGIAGDVGMASTHSYMFLRGESRRRLVDGGYESLRLSRATRRAVSRVTIGRPGFFMTTCAGFDNRSALPPMFPFDRFQDHLFAACLRRAEPTACIAWLPEQVRHQPRARARGERDSLFSPTDGIHTALHVMMAANATEATDLKALGQALEATGSASARDYRDFIEDRHAAAVSRRLALIDRLLDQHEWAPAMWADDLQDCAERWTSLMQRDDPSVPADLVTAGHSPERAWATCQAAVREFGALMQRWPEIFEAARDLRAAGEGAGEPLTSATP